MVEILCCEHCRIVIADYDTSYSNNNVIYCQSCYEVSIDSDEDTYSSSDDDMDKCYYCGFVFEYNSDFYEDVEPCKPRYYCMNCLEHIHNSDIEGEDF